MIRSFSLLICLSLAALGFSHEDGARERGAFLSTPEQVGALNIHSEHLVGGIINPLSGSPTLSTADLVVKGAQDLILRRTYIAPYMPVRFPPPEEKCKGDWDKYHFFRHLALHYRGWDYSEHLNLQFIPSERRALLTLPSGQTLCFLFRFICLKSGNTEATLEGEPYGISNFDGQAPSGANDPRNIRMTCERDQSLITLYAADGTTRFYRFHYWTEDASRRIYFLDKERLPNGKLLKYHYWRGWLTRIESLDPKERFVYASIQVEGNPSPFRENIHFCTSSGQTADYTYHRRQIKGKIKKKATHWYTFDGFKQRFDLLSPPILTDVSSPRFRKEAINHSEQFLLETYHGKERDFKIIHGEYGEEVRAYRAHQLLLPVGDEGSFIPVYELSYEPPIAGEKGGTTTVKSSDQTLTLYHYSKNLLISKIEQFDQTNVLRKEKRFFWDEQQRLKSIEIWDGQKILFSKRAFEYDTFGNPTLETITGDLTGSGKITSTTIKRLFSDDGKNLLLREERENGKITCFSYLPDTNLPTSKRIQDKEKIIQREFWIYDDCHNLIEHILDDGKTELSDDLTGVTIRRKTSYLLRQSPPFLHMPEWAIETYLDSSGSEKLLKKRHLIHDSLGNIAREEIYDSEENFVYAIEKTYNERGDILTETNRLGQIATYTYDQKGRKTSETNFSKRVRQTHRYDARGRRIQTLKEGDDGKSYTTSLKYDLRDRLIETRDLFGNTTSYTYDPLTHQVIQTDYPKIGAINGKAQHVITRSTYDPFGRESVYTDANGNKTTCTYNLYGAKTEIFHQNGGRETFLYAKTGELISHTDADQLTTLYENDSLGRVLKKTILSPQNEPLAEESFTYNNFHLTSERDKEGTLTQYFYDGAGRKIRETVCERVTEFAYDPLGRLATLYKYNGDNTLITHYERDLEDRLTLEEKRDASDALLYKIGFSYDPDGNRSSIIRTIMGQETQEKFAYDPFEREIYHQDALGYETLTFYNETHLNAHGQKVLQVKQTDPKGIITLRTQDALKRNIRVEKRDPTQATLLAYENVYDPQGNLILHKDHIYSQGAFRSTQAVCYDYNPDHTLKRLTQAFETVHEKKTSYTYTKAGKMIKKTTPDGITLSYTYDPLGFLARLDSSDSQIAHIFLHNRLGDLLLALDKKNSLKIEREVDPFGNILTETDSHGIRITKTYDNFDRPLSLTIEGHGRIDYTYDPLNLKTVERTLENGDSYKHTYDQYDLSGNLIQESPIGNIGEMIHTIDPRGLKTHIMGLHFTEARQYDAIQNPISIETDGETTFYHYDDTSQIIREESNHSLNTYANDTLHNRTEKNQTPYKLGPLNELLSSGEESYTYDLKGNRTSQTGLEQKLFCYDPLNRLTQVVTDKEKIEFLYDPIGRRVAKISFKPERAQEYYLWDGQEEVGSFSVSDRLDSFRILSPEPSPKTLSVELEGKPFVPITDLQGNIRRLVDIDSKTIVAKYDFTAFGERVNPTSQNRITSPWQFASKRWDKNLGLIHFGKREYDPTAGRWLNEDPAGFGDSFNPYQYALNNPFRYSDPHGENIMGILVGLGEIALGGAIIISGGVLEVATCGGFTIGLGLTTQTGLYLIGAGVATTSYYVAQEVKLPKIKVPTFSDQSSGLGSGLLNNDSILLNDDYSSLFSGSMYKKKGSSKTQKRKEEKARKKDKEERSTIEGVPKGNPYELLDNKDWTNISHPKGMADGKLRFRNEKTGEELDFHFGKPGKPRHQGRDHWHRPNPNKKIDGKEYLNGKGEPVPKNHPDSHLYPADD